MLCTLNINRRVNCVSYINWSMIYAYLIIPRACQKPLFQLLVDRYIRLTSLCGHVFLAPMKRFTQQNIKNNDYPCNYFYHQQFCDHIKYFGNGALYTQKRPAWHLRSSSMFIGCNIYVTKSYKYKKRNIIN